MYKFKLIAGKHRANFKTYFVGDFFFSEKRIDKVNPHFEYIGIVEPEVKLEVEPEVEKETPIVEKEVPEVKEVEKTIEPKKKPIAKKPPVKRTRKRETKVVKG